MTKFTVNADAETFARKLRSMGRQLPFASALALTRTAFEVKDDQPTQMRRVFRSPVAYTLRAPFAVSATKQNLVAKVTLNRNNDRRYLVPEVRGVSRDHTEFEGALRAKGVLKSSEYVVPGPSSKADAAGNVIPRLARKILAVIGGAASKDQFFAAKEGGHLPRGIYQKTRSGIKLLLIFADMRPKYRELYPFFDLAGRKAREVFPRHFAEAIRKAIATAR